MTNIIRVIRADWQLSPDQIIDCYEFPDGEQRIGITGASLAIKRSKEYLGRLGAKALKSLKQIGYEGNQREGLIERKQGGTTSVKTISKRDFVKIITWDATVNNNISSIILLAAFAETGIDVVLNDLFKGKSLDALAAKIVHYTKWTNGDLQKALKLNYEDWALIAEQELFLSGEY